MPNGHDSAFVPEMDSEAPVFAGALQTNPDPISHTDPLRVEGAALKAKLREEEQDALDQ